VTLVELMDMKGRNISGIPEGRQSSTSTLESSLYVCGIYTKG